MSIDFQKFLGQTRVDDKELRKHFETYGTVQAADPGCLMLFDDGAAMSNNGHGMASLRTSRLQQRVDEGRMVAFLSVC